jgi:glycine/serine hydroxymethyltransferase
MGPAEMATIATLMARVLRAIDDLGVAGEVRDEVASLCSNFTPYPELAG